MLIGMNRRVLMRSALVASLTVFTRRFGWAAAKCEQFVRIGAIRWDAWYDPDDKVGRAVAGDLTPEEYRFRLPFFADVHGDASVTIDGNQQVIFDREIEYAADAGLSYWAFVAYNRQSALTRGLTLYLNSASKKRIDFCMVAELTTWRDKDIVEYHVQLMADPSYVTVLDKRPLYFIGFLKNEAIQSIWGGRAGLRQALDAFRYLITQKGLNTPYIVILDFSPDTAAGYARDLGCDAIGTYAVNHNPQGSPFAQLAREASDDWAARAATGISVVPTITTGFDERPRVQTPWPWQAPRKNKESQMQYYYHTPRPEEIGEEVTNCVGWVRRNPGAAPAQVALVYAWNENDEGGWLIPTYPTNSDRLTAVHDALCSNM